IKTVTGEHEIGENLRERLIDVTAVEVVVEAGYRRGCLRNKIVEIADRVFAFRRRRSGNDCLGEGRGRGDYGRCGRHEGLEEELDLLQGGAGRRRPGELRRRTKNVRDLKVEARRAAGGDDGRTGAEGFGDHAGKEVRLEETPLIGVGPLEHRDLVELAGREGRMKIKRQDFRIEIGSDAEAAEECFIREELRCGQTLEAGQGQGAVGAELGGVFLGKSVAQGLVRVERWYVMIHVPAALDNRAVE